MKNLSELYSQHLSRIQKEREKILLSNNYMSWLEKFTIVYPQFTDNQWLDYDINNNDYSNVTKLCYLFEAIEKYADNNCIAPKSKENTVYYIISFNNIIFEIGKVIGIEFYCKRKKGNYDSISFSDIISDFKNTHS